MVTYKHNEPYYELHLSQLPEDTVRVLSFQGEEHISRLFVYSFELLSNDPELDSSSILNKKATFVMNRGDEEPIKIHGIISKFEQRGRTPNYVSYYAVLIPKMWRLTLTYLSEIYQKMDVQKIVTQVLKNSGFSGTDYKFNLDESYPELEYIVQYRETNFNFINRRMEHFGIFYYFDHQDDNDVIVFTDSNDLLPAIEQQEDIYYNPNKDPLSEKETISELICQANVVTGLVRLKDYNYCFPSRDLKVESQIDQDSPGMYYEYGDHFKDTKEGDFLAKVRNEEILSNSKIFKGKSDCRLFRAGFKFKMGEHYKEDWNNPEYILTKVLLRGTQHGLFAVLPESKKVMQTFENYFEAIPINVEYRPPRVTSIPRLYGIMNSVTQAAQGEKYAYIDDQGRYRLKMPFDLSDTSADEASQLVRLASPHAGAGHGMHFPQHAGVEIAWSCIDGNLDRPIGVGTVPNPSTSSPVNNSNKSNNILNTSSGNTLEMQDAGGSEQITLATPYANTVLSLGAPNDSGEGEGILLSTEADLTINVKGDRKMTIDEDDIVSIGEDRKINIGGDKKESVEGDEIIKIKGDKSRTVKGNVKAKTGGNHSLEVKKNISTKAKGNIKASSAKNITTGAKKNIVVGAKKDIKVNANKKIAIGAKKDIMMKTKKNLKVSTKKNTNFLVTKHFNVVSKKKVAIVAKDKLIIKSNKQIVLKCGSGSITMKQDGSIKIKAMKIQIQGQTDLKMKALKITSQASVSNKIKGAMVNVEARGINTIKGSLVKIN